MTPRTTVDAPSLQERLGDPAGTDPRLIDVRTPAEYEAGHIPGAVNVPLDLLRDQLGDLCSVLHGHTSSWSAAPDSGRARPRRPFPGRG